MSKVIPYIILLVFLNSCSPIIKTHGYTIENTSDFSEFISEIASNEKVSKQKILDDGDRWESVLAKNIKLDKPYR